MLSLQKRFNESVSLIERFFNELEEVQYRIMDLITGTPIHKQFSDNFENMYLDSIFTKLN